MQPYYPILFFSVAYILTYLTIPKIINLVEYKNLMDKPNNRSSHNIKTPTLGGASFFYTLILALFFLKTWGNHDEAIYFIPGLTILFIVGLKDDLLQQERVDFFPRFMLLHLHHRTKQETQS